MNRAVKLQAKEMYFQSVTDYFKEFCNCTSVHGFRYFSEKNRTVFERIWWLLAFSISLASCVVVIFQTYQKWDDNAVIVTLSNKLTPIYDIPFPAVTICPESKIPNVDAMKIIPNYSQLDRIHPTDVIKLLYIDLMCEQLPQSILENLTFIVDNHIRSNSFLDFLNSAKPNFLLLSQFYYFLRPKFVPVITDEGICYSFNLLNTSDIFRTNVQIYKNFFESYGSIWSLDDGYSQSTGYFDYPFRVHLGQVKNGLKVEILTSEEDLDCGCKRGSQGYKVLLHNPSSLPSPSSYHFMLSLNQSTEAIIKPVLTLASDSIRKYNIRKRNCYFQNERNLAYFKQYTLSNCQIECRTNYTLAMCNCVEFFMPRVDGTNVCQSRSTCVALAQEFAESDNILKKVEDSSFGNSKVVDQLLKEAKEILTIYGNLTILGCGCLPTCTELTYQAEISQSYADFETWIYGHGGVKNTSFQNKSHVTVLNMFFEANEFVANERKELYGPTDFVANFGGLLGLFCGFSLLSFVEILYFLSIRMICNKNLFGKWIG